MMNPPITAATRWLCAAALAASAPLAQAIGVTDAVGDYVAGFAAAGGSTAGDLDVVSSFVTYDPGTDLFTVSGTMNAAIGTTPLGFFVWGFNTGTGNIAPFAGIGAPDVKFNATVVLRPGGASTAGGTAVVATISGNTISTQFDADLLPSTGAAKADYTWNLWPRDGALAGSAAVSDFAPDNAMFAVAAVPEPASLALLVAGLGALGLVTRRRLQR